MASVNDGTMPLGGTMEQDLKDVLNLWKENGYKESGSSGSLESVSSIDLLRDQCSAQEFGSI